MMNSGEGYEAPMPFDEKDLLLRVTPDETYAVPGCTLRMSDVPNEVLVEACPDAGSRLVVWGKRTDGEWAVNWGERAAVRALLIENLRLRGALLDVKSMAESAKLNAEKYPATAIGYCIGTGGILYAVTKALTHADAPTVNTDTLVEPAS